MASAISKFIAQALLSALLSALMLGCAGPDAQLPDVSKVEIEAERQKQIAFDFERYMRDLDRVKSVGHRVLTAKFHPAVAASV